MIWAPSGMSDGWLRSWDSGKSKTAGNRVMLFFSGVFRGRSTVRYPPFGSTMKIFYRRLYMKRCVFCRFPANFSKNGEFAASIECSKAKSVSASGGENSPTRARAMPPLCQILNTPLYVWMLLSPVVGHRRQRNGYLHDAVSLARANQLSLLRSYKSTKCHTSRIHVSRAKLTMYN